MPTRGELMYFSLGLALGGAVGANWSKIKPLVEAYLGPAAEGFQDAYADILTKTSQMAEAYQDSVAERAYERRTDREHAAQSPGSGAGPAPHAAAQSAQAASHDSPSSGARSGPKRKRKSATPRATDSFAFN